MTSNAASRCARLAPSPVARTDAPPQTRSLRTDQRPQWWREGGRTFDESIREPLADGLLAPLVDRGLCAAGRRAFLLLSLPQDHVDLAHTPARHGTRHRAGAGTAMAIWHQEGLRCAAGWARLADGCAAQRRGTAGTVRCTGADGGRRRHGCAAQKWQVAASAAGGGRDGCGRLCVGEQLLGRVGGAIEQQILEQHLHECVTRGATCVGPPTADAGESVRTAPAGRERCPCTPAAVRR